MQWDGTALVVNHNLELKEAGQIFFFLFNLSVSLQSLTFRDPLTLNCGIIKTKHA